MHSGIGVLALSSAMGWNTTFIVLNFGLLAICVAAFLFVVLN
jgi:hypothetical protein